MRASDDHKDKFRGDDNEMNELMTYERKSFRNALKIFINLTHENNFKTKISKVWQFCHRICNNFNDNV